MMAAASRLRRQRGNDCWLSGMNRRESRNNYRRYGIARRLKPHLTLKARPVELMR